MHGIYSILQVGMSQYKVQKPGRDANTRRLPDYRKIVVKEDQKATLHLLFDYATDVE